MKKMILILINVLIGLIVFSCKDSITNPEPKPGRRDYVWTADTIKVPFTYFNKIWGDAPDNVWVVGPGGGLDKTIWHFDGSNWSTDGISRGISPLSVWGFGKKDIWTAGREGRIWRYNGSWKMSLWYKKDGWDIGFQEIYGNEPNNVFAVGYADSANFRKSIILKWNGEVWKEINTPIFTTYAFITMRKSFALKSNYYTLGWGEKQNGGDLLALFEFDGTNITKIYEADFVSESWSMVENIGNEVLFVIGKNICKYINGSFVPIINIPNSTFNLRFSGRSEKDIFLSMKDGIAHYNGSDIQYIYRFNSNQNIFGFVVLESEIFVLVRDSNNNSNIILRGKLQ